MIILVQQSFLRVCYEVCNLYDLPLLANLTSEGESFRGVSSVIFNSLPSIEIIDLPYAFEKTDNRSISSKLDDRMIMQIVVFSKNSWTR